MEQKYPEVKKYRPDIEGLRGFAIICVIIYHLNSNFLPGGFLGVDIFSVVHIPTQTKIFVSAEDVQKIGIEDLEL